MIKSRLKEETDFREYLKQMKIYTTKAKKALKHPQKFIKENIAKL